MKINVSLVKFILELKKDDFMKLDSYIKDFIKDFFPKNKKYWEYEIFARFVLDKDHNKIFCIHDVDNCFDKKVILKYATILNALFESNLFADFFCHISGKENQSKFLNFISYLKSHYEQKNKILKNLTVLLKMDINEFVYVPLAHFDGIYNIKINSFLNSGIFTDGDMNWMSEVNSSFLVECTGANYIIEYQRGKNVYNYINMKVKNLEFSYQTIPSRERLYGPKNSYPESCYQNIALKTEATNLIIKINSCLENIDSILNIYKELVDSLETKSKEDYDELRGKLQSLDKAKKYFQNLKTFLIFEYQKQGVMETSELQKSIEQMKKTLKG